jgi:DMSO/TMAO reductase YedYZ molybdopterin-dependent catalytic subunit
MKRRDFVEGLALSASGILAACNSQGAPGLRKLVRRFEGGNETLERALYSPSRLNRVRRDAALAGEAFPSYFISPKVPVWEPAVRGAWRLEVGGAVRRPQSLSVEDLVAMRGKTQRVDHFCVEGWTARAEFSGVTFAELARLVEPTPDAGYVDFQSFDKEYHESWDLESAMHPQTLVAYAVNGHYLNAFQGAPARVHSPVKLGYKNTKYLTRIIFMPSRNGGYWSDQGYEWYGGT